MKLATYRSNAGESRVALVHGGDNRLFDLAQAAERAGGAEPAFHSMQSLIDSGRRGLKSEAVALAEGLNAALAQIDDDAFREFRTS